MHAQFDLGLNKGLNYIENKQLVESIYKGKYLDAISKEAFPSLAIQPRYYFLHKKQQVKAATGFHDFMQACLYSEYSFYRRSHSIYKGYDPGKPFNYNVHMFKTGPLFGFSSGFSDMVI